MPPENYLNKLFGFKNRIVMVTGATGQLGYGICEAFIKAGAFVYGIDMHLNEAKIIRSQHIIYHQVDISNKSSIARIVDRIYAEQERLDVLVNNAGVSCFEAFEDRTEESFDWVMDVNLKGTFFCIQAYTGKVKKTKPGGSIVNIGSIYGVISPDFRIYTDCDRRNSEVYGATKAGIIQMTRYFAVHLAHCGIRVNCISPGGIFNPEAPQGINFVENYSYRCPMGRMANVDDLIGGVLYLASSAAQYTTGQNLVIDGGFSCW